MDTAYVYLPDDEKIKDLEHVKMAITLMAELQKGLDKKNNKQVTADLIGDEIQPS